MDFDISPIWKEQHTFLKPVIFSPRQVFSGANFKFSNQNKGAISFFDGNEWKILEIGNASQSLIVTNGLPSWGGVDISTATGVLSVESGGTGLSRYEPGSLIFAQSKNNLANLKPGTNGQILIVDSNLPCWSNFPGVTGNGKASYLAVWSSEHDICATNIQIDNEKLILKEKNSSISIGDILLSSDNDSFTIKFGKESLVLSKDTFIIKRNNKEFIKFFKGKLIEGIIPTSNLDGVLDVSKGGTGIVNCSVGGILYASEENKLSTLSIDNSNGFYLKSVNGMPQWAPVENSDSASITNNTTLALSPGTAHRAPMQFQEGELSNSPQVGAVEWDGKNVLVTNKDNHRRALLFEGDNINALAKGVSEIVPLNMGGTGKNLSNKTPGSLLFLETNSSFGILQPSPDKFIKFDENGLPTLGDVILTLVGNNGIIVSSDKCKPKLSIDQTSSFNPTWDGNHTFVHGVLFGADSVLKLPKNTKSRLPQIHFEKSQEPTTKQNGDVWFDDDLYIHINGSTINITANINKNSTQVQHLCIFEGISPVANTMRKIKYPLPYGADGITKLKWKFVRADLRIEDSPLENGAKLNIYVNDNPILESEMTITDGLHHSNSQSFVAPYAYSGDLISVGFKETSNSDCWSLYMTAISES